MDTDFNHHQHRRKFGHDYRGTWKYHITITKADGCPSFSQIIGRASDGPQGVGVELSDLGRIIQKAILSITSYHPYAQVYQYIVMPDHIHLLIRIKEKMEKPLGYIIGNLTGKIGREWRALMNDSSIRVFNEGYNDRIIYPHRSLDKVFNYIRQNPYRLAVRRERPEFFRRVNGLKVAGKDVQAYGNLFLLRNPFKEQVVVHRADSEAVRAANIERWLYASANGGVLVSPFISKAEKDVRRRAEEEGGRFILVINEGMGERYKPSGHDFNLCEQGRLLIISYPHPQLDRAACLALNAMAEQITNYQ